MRLPAVLSDTVQLEVYPGDVLTAVEARQTDWSRACGWPDVLTLFDYMYWVNGRLLHAAERVSPSDFAAESTVTTRNLHATLVHELDVEWSWRLSLQGKDNAELEVELRPEDFPTVDRLRERWDRDEQEMLSWLRSLTDESLDTLVEPSLGDRPRPLWHFLVHILTHAAQQQADAATELSRAGQSPREFGFVDFLISTSDRPGK